MGLDRCQEAQRVGVSGERWVSTVTAQKVAEKLTFLGNARIERRVVDVVLCGCCGGDAELYCWRFSCSLDCMMNVAACVSVFLLIS